MTRPDGSDDQSLAPEQRSGDTVSDAPPDHVGAPRPMLAGYAVGEQLGEGGMGEVWLAHDTRLERDVAVKRMRHAQPSDETVVRFWREARIQARLDHPAIVPVHEFGADSDGRPYFTMKRIPSATMHDLLANGDAPTTRLLRAFVDICLAIEFAHARGFVHRDLKPTNISLGDYGEVYVLDWGVARSLDGGQPDGAQQAIPTLDGATQVGALLGTPGYMAPEQARGEPVSTAADVYSLGCMLFEILAGEPLHPRGAHAALASTLTSPVEGPAVRRPDRDVPPELDAACTAALATEPAQRPSARELADRVQAYLDGDRDLERRRELAARELAAARGAGSRAEAIRRAGRALALDPESRDAAAFVVQLLIEPPAEVPAELERDLEEHQREHYARTTRLGWRITLSYFAFLPVLLWLGVRDWFALGTMYALVLAMAGLTAYRARTRDVWTFVLLALNTGQMIVLSTLLGPFVFVPAIICIYAMTTSSRSSLRLSAVIAWCAAGFLIPVALQAVGWMHRVWTIENDRLVLEPITTHLGGPAALLLLIGINLGTIIIAAVFSRAMARSRDAAHRRVEIQAWQLRQLLPIETRTLATS